ncbi:hypothetical protein [Streptomyces sp. NPDC058579]|uniref:hypothetical protein n=1 Tax=Streptomyces sp. NPDC058579 TaxID=3346548 RepID=UPI003657CC40
MSRLARQASEDDDGGLSRDALSLYSRMLRGELTQRRDEPGLEELLDVGLVVPNIFEDDLYLIADPFQVWRYQSNREREVLAASLRRLRSIETLFSQLPVRIAQGDSGVSYLASKDEANGEIIKALSKASRSIRTAHPVPRPHSAMQKSLPRDIDLLERGLKLATIYGEEARGREVESEWAREVTRRGAEVRTLQGRFRRIVLIDESLAIIGDHTRTQPAKAGWKVEHDGLIAFISELYEDQWKRAEPWLGGDEQAPSAGVTTPMTRKILIELARGRKLAAIAHELGVSTRTLTNHLTPLYERLGLEPGDQFGLGYWYATFDERRASAAG